MKLEITSCKVFVLMIQDKLFGGLIISLNLNIIKQKQTEKVLASLHKAFLFTTITFIKKVKFIENK